MAALDPITGSLGQRRAAHLLRRVTFGPTKQEIDQFAALNINSALAQIFQVVPLPEPPVDPATGQDWISPKPVEDLNSDDRALISFFKSWWLERMRTGGVSIVERLTYFLHTHFTTKTEVVGSGAAIYYQNALMRQYATGNFKELTRKICLDNAMLVFLDSNLNEVGRPNENFGRELLELYTIGKGAPAGPDDYTNYTEQDVQAAAKVLSGYKNDRDFNTTDPDTGLFLDPDTELAVGEITSNTGQIAVLHDATTKQFSARFNNATISPPEVFGERTTVEGALDELDQLLDMIFDQEETARHICRKLYRFFMYYEITDEVEQQVIEPLAATFRATYDLQPVLEQLLASQHFYDEDNATLDDDNNGAIIKSPLEVVIGMLRFFDVTIPDQATSLENMYDAYGVILRELDLQGIDLYNPFEVAGYAAYHQEPGYNRNWISANYLAERYKFIDILKNEETLGELGVGFNSLDFVRDNITDPGNAESLVEQFIQYLLPEVVTDFRKNYFLHRVFLGLQDGDFDPDTNLPIDTNADLTDDWQRSWDNQDEVELTNLLDNLIRGLLQSPEYQLF